MFSRKKGEITYMETDKNNKPDSKLDIFKILLMISSITLILLWVLTLNQKNIHKSDTEGQAQIETISSGVQRVAKLELEGSDDNSLFAELEILADELVEDDGKLKYFTTNTEVYNVVDVFLSDFHTFANVLNEFHDTGNRELFFSASENNYEVSSQTSKALSAYINDLSDNIDILNNVITVNVMFIAVILIKILLNTLDELRKNKELSKDMYIDGATGLYNRAKCQEVLQTPYDPNNNKERAIIIFDLNDLKKTNDLHGHRSGDDLIAMFGLKLKEATAIFDEEIFVGRYGGDEFMAYFNSNVERDVTLYLEEVDYVMEQFNENESKEFKLSCAAGYSITTEETREAKLKDLFDEADANMYENKIAMKKKKKEELLAQGIEVEDHVDDRL